MPKMILLVLTLYVAALVLAGCQGAPATRPATDRPQATRRSTITPTSANSVEPPADIATTTPTLSATATKTATPAAGRLMATIALTPRLVQTAAPTARPTTRPAPSPTQAVVPTAPPTRTAPTATKSPVRAGGYTCPDGQNCIKGNINSDGEKIYHFPGCANYNQTQINESQGERWFATAAEAEAAGWRKAMNCP